MEKGREIRIVGNAEEEQKEAVRKQYIDKLTDHLSTLSEEDMRTVRLSEYPKTEQQMEAIKIINEQTSELMRRIGVAPFDIPQVNYHLIPEAKFKGMGRIGNAYADYDRQAVIFNAEFYNYPLLRFATFAFHETMHLKAHLALEVSKGNEKNKESHFRHGVSVLSSRKSGDFDSRHSHLGGLHEAIVSKQQIRSFDELLDLPIFSQEKEWLRSDEAEDIRKELAAKKDIPEEEVYWFSKDGKEYSTFTYREHRRTLDYVCREIVTEFPHRFKDEQAVFQEFLKAHFSGRLLDIARLVDGTFGDGSFRLLGMMRGDDDSPVATLEALHGNRRRFLKDKEKQLQEDKK
jgi:hypothetical protein